MNKLTCITVAAVAAVALVGCDTGEAPKGLSAEETRAAVEQLKPEDQIAYINRSPMPTAEKAKKIAEIKAKAGIR